MIQFQDANGNIVELTTDNDEVVLQLLQAAPEKYISEPYIYETTLKESEDDTDD